MPVPEARIGDEEPRDSMTTRNFRAPRGERGSRSDPAARWFAGSPLSSDECRIRLFCFPHAGGGSALFRPWRAELASRGIDVLPLVLPGRESRIHEPAYRRVVDLVEALAEVLPDRLDTPYAFFGHSMGAVVAYETARALARRDHPRPRCLLVSGRRAPGLPSRRRLFSELSDEVLLEAMGELNGTPAEILRDRELMRLFLPCLRADLELNEYYIPLPGESLDVPITAMGGTSDPEVDPDELSAWGSRTTGTFHERLFEGDHFYLKGAVPEVMTTVRSALGIA
ncbi:medium-chain acyl-[acyl-carrier-protein] hydrolase [Actinopolyspora lacussalsi]|nr:medium-chain acyl-[acyl-carrier-protein] hydrolase [Actinopolyspora lacussalsi]